MSVCLRERVMYAMCAFTAGHVELIFNLSLSLCLSSPFVLFVTLPLLPSFTPHPIVLLN